MKLTERQVKIRSVFRDSVLAHFANAEKFMMVNTIAILFLKGRIKFVDGLCVTGGGGAGCGSMLAAWGEDNVKALKSMGDLGLLISPRGDKNL